MARDRKRAKQRQRQRQRRPPDESQTAARAFAQGSEDEAPDPLEHASAEVDIAEAALVDPPEAALEPDEMPQEDELDEVGAEGDGPGKDGGGRRPTARGPAPGAELPKEGNRLVNFLRACVAELRRVQWPDRRQVTQATGVVLGFVIIAGAYLGLLDAVFSRLVKLIL